MATATKKSSTKTNAKPKSSAKPKTKKSSAKPKTNGKPKTSGKTKQIAPRAPRVDKYAETAKKATALVLQHDRNGKPTVKRGPVSTQQVDRVARNIGRRKPADVLTKTLGFASVVQAERYSGDKLGKSETLPDGARAKMSEMSSAIGDDNHKIAGRKLSAILVALTK